MPDISPLPVAAATALLFVIGGAYYAAFGHRISPAAAPPAPPCTYAAELARCLVLALVLTGVTARAAVDTVPRALTLGFTLWLGTPLVPWTGAIVHERTPLRLATVHAGDWLIKLLAPTPLTTAIQ